MAEILRKMAEESNCKLLAVIPWDGKLDESHSEAPTRSQPTPTRNSWNEFQRAHKGEGWTAKHVQAEYQRQKALVGASVASVPLKG